MHNISGDIDKNYQPQICLHHLMKLMNMYNFSVQRNQHVVYHFVLEAKLQGHWYETIVFLKWPLKDPTNNEEKRKHGNNWAMHSAAETGEQRDK